MIEKQDFYWGAALVRVLDDARCRSVGKDGCFYLVNSQQPVVLKYSTNSRTPWVFSFSEDEITRLDGTTQGRIAPVVGCICGGDGICAMKWTDVARLLGNRPGALSVKRRFHQRYGVSGPSGHFGKKIAINQWPGLVFTALATVNEEVC